MTEVSGTETTLADRIAARGRDALVERLRNAYADAAASHSDIVSLDQDRIEALVQSAADRADGLQWRRALATVASQELGVSLAQALTHPAVREAQEQLGAPSYEAGLAELVARPLPPALTPEPAPIEEQPWPPPIQPEMMIDEPEAHGATDELEAVEAEATEPAEEYVGEPTQPHALDLEQPAPAVVEESYGEAYGSEHTDYPPPQDWSLQVLAYHLGGVANLPTGRDGLDLRLSESGLDILAHEGEIIGRLHWNEIDSLEVIAVRGRLRKQARTLSRIVVRTKHGDASFEVPGIASEELEARIEPLISRYASG